MAGKSKHNQDTSLQKNNLPSLVEEDKFPSISHHLLRALDASSDTVMLTDTNTHVLYANKAMQTQLNCDESQLIGQQMTDFWVQPNTLTQHILSELAQNRPWNGFIQYKTMKNSLFSEITTISPLADEKGVVTHFIKTGQVLDNKGIRAEACDKIDTAYKSILNLMSDGYLEADLRGNFTFINKSAARIYQRTPEEMVGRNYKAYMTSMEAEKVYHIFNEIFRTGESDRIIDYEVISEDGTSVSCETIISLLHDNQGEVVGFGGVIRDVTEKKKLAKQLKDSEESYYRVMELAPDAITISRVSDGRYFEVNQAFCQQTGYLREEVIGRTVDDLNIYTDPEDRIKIIRALRSEGRVSSLKVTFQHRDGSLLHDIISGRIIQFKGEECILFVCTLINPLVETQEALKESEKRSRIILEAAPDAICLTRLEDGKYIVANEMFYKRTGFTPEETIGRTAHDINIYADKNDREKFVAAMLESGQVDNMEILTRFKDGSLSHQLWSGRIIDWEGEKCLLVVAKMIDDLKKAQLELRESESRFRAIFETAADAIFVTDPANGRFLDVNQAACKHLGFHEEELQTMVLDNVVHPQHPYRKPLFDASGNQTRQVFFESIHVCKDGSQIPVEISSGMMLRYGHPALLSIVRDVRERKQAETELSQYRKNLEEMVQDRTLELEEAQTELLKRERLSILGQLTAMVSHELRNPLGVIRSSSFYLKRKIIDKDEKVHKHIGRIEEQVTLCDIIVQDLLEYTRGRKVSISKQAVGPWAKQVAEQIKESEQFDIKMNIPDDLPSIPHDREKMRRVLINLLDNAIQSVRSKQKTAQKKPDTYHPAVSIEAYHQNTNFYLQVWDNGIGMDERTRKQAFEPLFTTRSRGTGIGLAIVSKIISEHGGRIELETEKNKGAKFTIVLPLDSDPLSDLLV